MASSQVILKEKITGLGAEADVVKVRAGYARNFLIPQGKAYEANQENLKHIEELKAARAKREADELLAFQEIATKLTKMTPSFELATGQNGKAFGSVTTMDIHKKLADEGIDIDRHAIDLDKAIKSTGKFDISIKLHAQVVCNLAIKVDAVEAAEPGQAEEVATATEKAPAAEA